MGLIKLLGKTPEDHNFARFSLIKKLESLSIRVSIKILGFPFMPYKWVCKLRILGITKPFDIVNIKLRKMYYDRSIKMMGEYIDEFNKCNRF